MADPGGEQEQDAKRSDEAPAPPKPSLPTLPKAADELARQDFAPVPVYDLFTDAHTQRLHEATVQERETRAKQAEENRKLRKRVADHVSLAVAVQVLIADVAFFVYGFWNGWNIPGATIIAWLSATVVQVIAVALVVTKSLFPAGATRDAPKSE